MTDTTALPATADLLARRQQLVDFLGNVDNARLDLVAIDARLSERGIDPANPPADPAPEVPDEAH